MLFLIFFSVGRREKIEKRMRRARHTLILGDMKKMKNAIYKSGFTVD
jgi:hypothetical protein